MMRSGSVWFYVCGLFLSISCVASGVILDQLTDPINSCLAPFLDIIEARVEEDAGDLTFVMRLRGMVPTSLPKPTDTLMFLWLIDADRNFNTGDFWEKVGADFKVVAKIGQLYGGGKVEVLGSIPGGGPGTVTITKDTIRITIRSDQIGLPVDFDWCVVSAAIIDGWFVSANKISDLGSTIVLPNIPPYRVEVFPPMLCLSPTSQTSGQLSVRLFDEYGLQLPAERYTVQYHSSNPTGASVDSAGLVTLLPGSTTCDQPIWISASVDGLESVNQVLARVMEGPMPIRHRLWTQDHIGLFMPIESTPYTLEQFVDHIRAADIMESVYRSQKGLSGLQIFQGGTQYLIVDDGNCDNPITCNTGNPIRLNWKPDLVPPADQDPIDMDHLGISWVGVFQEMGRNFLSPSETFRQLTTAASTAHNTAFADALAALEAHWSRYRLIRCGSNLEQTIREAIEKEYALREKEARNHLLAYQSNGPAFGSLEGETLCGILYELHDEFGDKVWFDLFSTLLPEQEALPLAIITPQQQAAWLVAALSASTGQDLRERFATRYGFEIDSQIWQVLLETAQKRISARPWTADNPADLDCDQQVWIEDLWRMAEQWMRNDCAGPWWCGSADLDRNGRVDLWDMDAVSNQWLWTNCPPSTLP